MNRIKILFGIIICLTFLTGTVAVGRPTVILTFDDGWRSVLDKAYPIMQANSQRGVDFIITDQPELSWNGQPDNYMNVSQLQQLYNSGWDLSSHTYSHANLTTVNSTTLNYELNASKSWLDKNGYPRGSMFLSYPEGAYNPSVIAAAKSNKYVAARTILPVVGYPNYNLTSPDVFELKTYEAIGGVENDTTIINQIDNAIAADGLLILTFHKIVDNLSADEDNASTEFKTTDFQNVSNYLQSRSSDVDVRTLSDYFGVVPLPTYMPPTPIDTTLNGSKNLTWAAGEGNVTDYFNYNVNGTWYNESNTTFYNVTDLSQNYTVKVYSVNSTNGITINSTPAILNSIATPAPTTPKPTFNISGFKINNATSSGVQGWNITLMNSTMQKSMLTDINGSYMFTNLVNGTYNVTEENKTGWTNVSPMFQQVTINGADIMNINFTNQPTTLTPIPTVAPTSPPGSGGSGSSSGSGGSSGGGGGGGGDGISGENFSNIIVREKHDRDIYTNKVTQYVFTNSNNPILYINITGNANAGEINAAVEVLRDTSSLVKAPAPGKVYTNVNILVGLSGFANPRNIKNATIGFRVENSWIVENLRISDNKVKMVKWNGSKWDLLETTERLKDNKYTYFEAKTNAFSPFAITGLEEEAPSIIPPVKVNPSITPTATETPADTEASPAGGASQINWSTIIAALAIIGTITAVGLKLKI